MLKQAIYSLIDSVADRVYDSRTPTNKTYPYVNINYPSIGEADESFRQNIILELDIWDNETDTTALETLTDAIDKKLNRYVSNNLYFRIYRLNPYRLELDDGDENIRRRQLRYQVLIFKEEN